jgi:hypothetical protein
MSMDGRYFAKSQEGGAIYEPVVAHGCAVMSRKDGISQGAMDGGAINEPKDGEDGYRRR